MEKIKESRPSAWFFAEWISIIGTFIVCFVFLFYQNQIQSARSDKLYEMFCSVQTDYNSKFDKINEKFYDLLKDGRK